MENTNIEGIQHLARTQGPEELNMKTRTTHQTSYLVKT